MTNTKRAALYLRVSTETQRDANTIQSQEAELRRVAARSDYLVVQVYADNGVSGTSLNRPELNRLLKDAGRDQFDAVLIWGQDRLSRTSISDMTLWLAAFRTLGIPLIDGSTMRDVASDEPTDELLTVLGAWRANQERVQILERTRRGKRRVVAEGGFGGGVVPYGYRVNRDTRRLEIAPTEAEVVREIFRLTAEDGLSTGQVAAWLNDHGVQPKEALSLVRKTSGLWSADQVRATVRNTTYKGVQRWGRRSRMAESLAVIESACDPIVQPEIWARAQDVIDSHRKFTRATDPHKYPLSGLCRCAQCGKTLVGITMKTYRYYRCNGWSHPGPDGPCRMRALRADWLEAAILTEITGLVSEPDVVRRYLAQDAEEVDSIGLDALESLNRAELEVRREAGTLVRVLGQVGIVGEKALRERLEELDTRHESIEAQRADWLARIDQAAKRHLRSVSAATVLEHLGPAISRLAPESRWRVVQLLVDKVVVQRDEPRATVYLRVPTDAPALQALEQSKEHTQEASSDASGESSVVARRSRRPSTSPITTGPSAAAAATAPMATAGRRLTWPMSTAIPWSTSTSTPFRPGRRSPGSRRRRPTA